MKESASSFNRPAVSGPFDRVRSGELVRHSNHARTSSRVVPAGRAASLRLSPCVLGSLGFVASVLSENLSTSRTCRLRNASAGRIRELIVENLTSLGRVASFLDRHQILLYRISSNLIPFASHPVNTVPWRDEYADTLAGIGARLRMQGVRVSTHPGQYTVLNSPHTSIVRAAVSELVYHATLLDALDSDTSCKIVVHVGGLYGGSEQVAMSRFVAAAKALPDTVRRRLVVENDDRLFDADEVLQVGRAAGVPVVFDWLHHQANPCRRPVSDVLVDIFQTWTEVDGNPKVHLSSQAAGAPVGAHARFVDVRDIITLLEAAPPVRFDCMLEAKEKDRALLRLRDELRARGIVETLVAGRRTTERRASPLQRERPSAHRLG
jgi:UV DNA damage endonuclease